MGKYLFNLFLLALPTIAVCQKDVSEKKTNELVINLPNETINFETLRYGSDFEAKKEKRYWWYKSGKIMETEGGFDGKLLDGKYTVFYDSRALKEQGQFKKGLKCGEWKSWHPNGNLKETIMWKKGYKHGIFQSYDEVGNLMVQSKYKKGKLHGKSLILVKGDSQVQVYKNGVEVIPEKKSEKSEASPKPQPKTKSKSDSKAKEEQKPKKEDKKKPKK